MESAGGGLKRKGLRRQVVRRDANSEGAVVVVMVLAEEEEEESRPTTSDAARELSASPHRASIAVLGEQYIRLVKLSSYPWNPTFNSAVCGHRLSPLVTSPSSDEEEEDDDDDDDEREVTREERQ